MEEIISSVQPQPTNIDLSTPPLPPVKKSPWLLILSLLLVVSLAAAGYFYWQNTQLISTSPANPSPSPTPIASFDPTINWKTYTNPVHNVTFKYPVDWALQLEDDQSALNASLKLIKDQSTIHMVFGVDGIGGQGRDYEGLPFNLDGHEVFKYKTHNPYDNSETVGITNTLKESLGVLMINKKTYILSLNYPTKYVDSGESTNLDQIFDQILSTFKFTDAAAQIPTSIDNIYAAVNKDFGVNFVPTREAQFYSLQGFVNQESWKLDLSSLLTDKPQITKLLQTLDQYLQMDQNNGADGVGQSVQGYENDQVYCFLLQGFNQSDYLSCITK